MFRRTKPTPIARETLIEELLAMPAVGTVRIHEWEFVRYPGADGPLWSGRKLKYGASPFGPVCAEQLADHVLEIEPEAPAEPHGLSLVQTPPAAAARPDDRGDLRKTA